jgi:hypothetical protein
MRANSDRNFARAVAAGEEEAGEEEMRGCIVGYRMGCREGNAAKKELGKNGD